MTNTFTSISVLNRGKVLRKGNRPTIKTWHSNKQRPSFKRAKRISFNELEE